MRPCIRKREALPKILGRLRAGNVRQFGAASTPEGLSWMFMTYGNKRKMHKRDWSAYS
jgi:hypothetical protein